MSEKKQPDVRFKGFNEDWEEKQFIDLVTRVSTSSSDHGLPRVEYEDIIPEWGKLNKDIYKKESYKSGILFDCGDILFGKLRPYLKNWLISDFSGIAVGDFWVLKPDAYIGEFIYYLMQNSAFQIIANRSMGTKMPRSDWNVVSKAEFTIASEKKEQVKIGELLKNLDNLIILNQSKYEKLVSIKKACFEKMFPKDGAATPDIRFKGFSGSWTQCKIGDIIKDYIEKTVVQNQYPVLTSSQQLGIVLQEKYFADRQVTTNDNIGYYVLPRGYFTYRSRSDTDLFVFNRNNIIDKGIISYYYPVFCANNSDSNFLLRRLNHGVKRQLSMAAEGTGQKVLAHGKFKSMDIMVTEIEEQIRIGRFFQSLDDLITLRKTELDKLKNIKIALLEKMFI